LADDRAWRPVTIAAPETIEVTTITRVRMAPTKTRGWTSPSDRTAPASPRGRPEHWRRAGHRRTPTWRLETAEIASDGCANGSYQERAFASLARRWTAGPNGSFPAERH